MIWSKLFLLFRVQRTGVCPGIDKTIHHTRIDNHQRRGSWQHFLIFIFDYFILLSLTYFTEGRVDLPRMTMDLRGPIASRGGLYKYFKETYNSHV